MISALAFIHVVSVVINQYSVIRHSFSLFEVGDMISLLKCWNERPHSRAEHFGRSCRALLGSPVDRGAEVSGLLIGLQTHFALADGRPNPSRLSSTAGSSQVSISLATKGFLFARSR